MSNPRFKELGKKKFVIRYNQLVHDLNHSSSDAMEIVCSEFNCARPGAPTISAWRKEFGLVVNNPKATELFMTTVNVYRIQNHCTVNEASEAVAKRLGCRPKSEAAIYMYFYKNKIQFQLPQVPCLSCNSEFHPFSPKTKICSECHKKYSSNIIRNVLDGFSLKEAIEFSKSHKLCTCGSWFQPRTRSTVLCAVCISKSSAASAYISQWSIHNCKCCGRLMYLKTPIADRLKSGIVSCKYCLDNLTSSARYGKRTKHRVKKICMCGNWYIRVNNSRVVSCPRCRKHLSSRNIQSWRNRPMVHRCSNCYSKTDVNSESRFCDTCLSKYNKKTLTTLCMTEEMKEEEDVKRYNKEFMRKHTRMVNRNKPKQPKTKQPKKTNYQEKLIDDMRDMAIIESLKSLIEE